MNLKSLVISIFIVAVSYSNNSISQTKGLIFEPATGAGDVVLDPNDDGYVSATTAGFVSNDNLESEIPYVAFILPGTEPTDDLDSGPGCGFTDFVDSGSKDPALMYVDLSNNWLFRLRMGSAITNAKSYSVLIDTDGLFGNSGPDADPDYTSANPGFEIEIVLATKFGVYVYDVDGIPNCTPVISYLGTTNYQKSIAYSEICGTLNYFLDFFVDFDDLTTEFGITSSTPMRFAIVDNMGAHKSTICNPASASDLAGVDGSCGSLAECYEYIIGSQGGCTLDDINSGLCLPKSECPAVDAILDNASSVSGSSGEADGTTITVYKNDVLIGTTTVTAGVWTLDGIFPALVSGDSISVTAQAIGEDVSNTDCNNLIVLAAECSDPITLAYHCGKSIQGRATVGAVINVYQGNSIVPSTPTAGTIYEAGVISATTTPSLLSDPLDNFLWKCVGTGTSELCTAAGPACLIDGAYRITATEPGKCESSPIWICVGGVGSTADPSIVTSPITSETTSISGTVSAPDDIAGVDIFLYANGFEIGTTTTDASGDWTIAGLSLNACDTIKAIAVNVAANLCPSNYTPEVVVTEGTSAVPTIIGDYCVAVTAESVTGTSSEPDGSIITVYDDGVLAGTGTVTSGLWSVSGLSIPIGNTITATCLTTSSCKLVSGTSEGVTVVEQSTNPVIITTSPVTEGDASVSGTGTDGDVIFLYMDGTLIPGVSDTVAGGTWTISGMPDYELYTGGILTATAETPGFCESAPSADVEVVCIPPTQLSIDPTSTDICESSVVSNVDVLNSESLIIYQLFLSDGITTTGSSILGTGDTITLVSDPLFSSTVLKVKALKTPPGSCEVFMTDTVIVTVNPNPDVALVTAATNAVICAGDSTTISIASSELGFNYQLRNDSDDSNIGSFVAGDGADILLSTGPLLTTTTFNILVTGPGITFCNGELTNLVTVTVNPNPVVDPITGVDSLCIDSTTVYANTTPGGTFSSDDISIVTVDTFTGLLTGVGFGTTNINYTVDSLGCSTTVSEDIVVRACGVVDTDGDGVSDADEIIDGTDPTDDCSYLEASVTLPVTSTGDCDGDGVSNADEALDGTDGNDPCDFVLASVTLIPDALWNAADCDGDGVSNGDEVIDGTDPLDDCSYLDASITLTVTSVGDCDGDGVSNADEALDGTDGTDPCDFVLASVTLTPDALWNAADCDGDGVSNGDEVIDGTDPLDDCSFSSGSITLTVTSVDDCDGDGVSNADEALDGTDVTDPCDFVLASVTLTPDALWNAADCDGDGVSNGDEIIDGTDPLDDCSYLEASLTLPITSTGDCDGDGVSNAQEALDGTDPFDDCSFLTASITLPVTSTSDCDGDGVTNTQEALDGTDPFDDCSFLASSITLTVTSEGDCDGDGVSNADEAMDGTDGTDPCDFVLASATLIPDALWNAADCDADGVSNGDEVIDGTDPLDDCSYLEASVTLPITSTGDCDGDGVTNAQEASDGTDPTDPCSLVVDSQTTPPNSEWNLADCDGDGVTNGDEILDGTDPTDPCDYVLASQTISPTDEWNQLDCDGDGIVNGNELDDELSIPGAFSPNNDGANDYFVINGIKNYPDASITIFNRWGNKVFVSKNGYNNDWDGYNQFGITTKSRELPIGTYFYILDLGDGSDVIKGYVYLGK